MFPLITDSCKTIEISILHENNYSFTDPLIIGTFEKRAPGPKKLWMRVCYNLSIEKVHYSGKLNLIISSLSE